MKKTILSLTLAFFCAFSMFAQNNSSKANLTLNEWNTDLSTNTRFLDHQTKYNSVGKKYEEAEYTANGIKWKKTFEYDQNGLITREVVYNEKGKIDNIRKYKYDALNNKIAEYIYNAKGKLVKIKEYEYIVN